jgi:hypothetical protein
MNRGANGVTLTGDMRWTRKPRAADAPLFSVAAREHLVEIKCAPGAVARPHGHDWARAQRLSRLLRDALTTGARTVIVDLEGSDDACTSLLAVLVEARVRARRRGVHLVTRGSPALHRLAEICRLECVLCPT